MRRNRELPFLKTCLEEKQDAELRARLSLELSCSPVDPPKIFLGLLNCILTCY